MAGLLLDAKAASSLRDQLEASRKNAALWKADYARMMEKRDAAEEKAITQAKQIAALTATRTTQAKQIEQLKEVNLNLNRMAFPSRYYSLSPPYYGAYGQS